MSKDITDFIAGSIIGFSGYFFGGLDGFMQVLLILTIVDYISGLCVGWHEHDLSSAKGFTGICRKVFIFALVGISHVIDKNFLGDTATMRTAVCLFYIGNEGISILENADKLGIQLPKVLIQHFRQFKEEDNKEK